MEYRQLLYFICIAKEGGYSRAAEKLIVSQSSLSRSIQNLEDEFNTQLIYRTTRSFKLTPSGEELLSRGTSIVDEFEDLEAYMQKYSSDNTGIIRPTSLPLLGDAAKWEVIAITNKHVKTPANVKSLINYLANKYNI